MEAKKKKKQRKWVYEDITNSQGPFPSSLQTECVFSPILQHHLLVFQTRGEFKGSVSSFVQFVLINLKNVAVPWWRGGLKIWRGPCSISSCCCDAGLTPGLGTSTCHRCTSCAKKGVWIVLWQRLSNLRKVSTTWWAV